MEIDMKKPWRTNLKQETGFVYPLILFILLLWTLFIFAGIEEVKLQRKQIQLDKELYELHTMIQMTKEKLVKEEDIEPVTYFFPNGTATIQSITHDKEQVKFHVQLTTSTNGQAEKEIILPNSSYD